MRLDFNVLWVEDQQQAVESQKIALARMIGNDGFRLCAVPVTSVAEAKSRLGESVYADHVDLILMDYDLGEVKGDTGLIEVREAVPFRDIVFYSANETTDLHAIVARTQVEGVYTTHRETLSETAHAVFETLVRKVVDIDHARGIVMGATSDIDQLINACLEAAFENNDAAKRTAILEAIKLRMKEIRERFDKIALAVEAAEHVRDIFDHHLVYSAADRLTLLRNFLKEHGLFAELHEPMGKYIFETVPTRNVLAHVRVERLDGFARRLVDNKGKELTSDDVKRLRQELLAFYGVCEKLLESLKRNEAPAPR